MRKFRAAFFLLALIFMSVALAAQWEKIRTVQWNLQGNFLALSLIGVVLLFFLDGYGWHLILKAIGKHIPIRRCIRIWLISSLARYVPGGIWSYASRVSLAKEEGVGLTSATLSLYLETLLLMTSSLATGFPALLAVAGRPFSPKWAILLWLLLGLMMHPKVISLLGYMPGKIGNSIKNTTLPTLKSMITLFGYYLVFWIFFGLIFDCFVSAIYPLPIHYWIPVGASMPLGFFVGFILLFVPGGIGIRESVLYVALLPFLAHPASLLVSVSSRLWIMIGEGLSLGIILIAFKKSKNKQRNNKPT